MKKLLTLLAALLLIAAVRVAGEAQLEKPDGPELDSIVASVNGEGISLNDVLPESRTRELALYAAFSGDELFKAIQEVRKQALEDIINRKLIVADYRRAPFEIPIQYTESLMDDIALNEGIRSRERFAARIRESGTTVEKLRKQVEERLIVQAMTARQQHMRSSVSPKDVYDYFTAHPGEFGNPETWQIALIVIDAKRENRAEIIAEITAAVAVDRGAFASLASRYSAGPNAGSGGDLGPIARSRLRREFAAAIPEAVEGQIYGPFQTPEGDCFLRLLRIIPEEKVEFQTIEPLIRAKLEAQGREEAMRIYIEKLRENAIIRYF